MNQLYLQKKKQEMKLNIIRDVAGGVNVTKRKKKKETQFPNYGIFQITMHESKMSF